MMDEILFDERVWGNIVALLPDNEEIKRVILDDFIWFIERPKRYNNVNQKVDDYIRHLRLKTISNNGITQNNSAIFRQIDIESIESYLKSNYCKLSSHKIRKLE